MKTDHQPIVLVKSTSGCHVAMSKSVTRAFRVHLGSPQDVGQDTWVDLSCSCWDAAYRSSLATAENLYRSQLAVASGRGERLFVFRWAKETK